MPIMNLDLSRYVSVARLQDLLAQLRPADFLVPHGGDLVVLRGGVQVARVNMLNSVQDVEPLD